MAISMERIALISLHNEESPPEVGFQKLRLYRGAARTYYEGKVLSQTN